MSIAELKHHTITQKIIGASFEVHTFLRNGFQEIIYQRALEYEMNVAGLSFCREKECSIFYKDVSVPIGKRRADFVVDDKIIVELNAVKELEDVHIAQILSYLKVYKFEVGLLINFGSKSLTFKRLVL